MAKFYVMDVGHGHCAFVQAANGNLMMFDCGHNTDPESRPSDKLRSWGFSDVHRFFVQNYDEDHISDLVNVRKAVNLKILHRNKSITPKQLRAKKLEDNGEVSAAMESLLEMMESYTGGVPNPPPAFDDVNFVQFHNSYGVDFDDTNNISLVTFINCNGTWILTAGDLEKAGWEKLLQNPSFCGYLKVVKYFVASHHGRENGYCKEIFDHCSPDVVIISDGEKQHATQEMVDTYAGHATGISWNGETRYVLTTRSDGDLSFEF